ncbi:hypothetical protein [Ekhidna sp.]|uniref:hypothetical protein n=1 Tax=Ekhidna sp. TaxID=2608089 RepID=UPI003CCBAC3C
MKKHCIFLIFLIGTSAYAQTGAFKKIMNDRATVNKEVFYDQLIQFQKENVEFSNVYYQLGKIELNIFTDLDPVVDRVASRQRIYNAKTNFGLAKNYLDDKEVAKNPDWYDVPDLKDRDSVTRMGVRKIESNYENTQEYSTKYEELVENYDRAVYHYLKAREGFIDINTSADNLRQLFLKADDSLKIAVRSVGVSFDSSMYHLDIYRQLYQEIPYKKKREVIVNKKKIDHFRMNGITPANFLADNIDVWDYKQWSDRFLNLLKVEVDGLQDEIKNAYKFFMATNDRMINGDECIQAELDDLKFQRIINLITKYDNESVLIDIFQYLIAKLEYGNKLTYEKNCNELNVPPTDDYISRKARIYQNLYTSFNKADSLDEQIIATDHGQETFQWFFDEMMPEGNGSETFAENQKEENYTSFKEELEGLMQQMRIQSFNTDSLTECYEADSIFLIPGAFQEDSFCAKKKLQLNDSLHLIQGIRGEDNLLIGAIPMGEDYEKVWELSPYKNSEVSYFKIVGDSSMIIGGYNGKAWITQLSTGGNEYFTALLKNNDTIKNVIVNQLQGVATILQKGTDYYTLSRMNFNGKVESTSRIELQGEYAGMIRQEQSLWLFTHNKNSEGSYLNATVYNEKENAVIDTVGYQLNASLINPSVIKNDNEYLTLIASNNDAEEEIVYALMNYEGKIEQETIF